ncbi:hypothetical protein BH09BAC1_BH09BAC1_18380 [soil metagenome]
MRQITIIFLLVCSMLAIGITGCKDDDDGSDIKKNEIADKVLSVLTVQDNGIGVYQQTLTATQDTLAAVNALGQWLLDQPEVDKAYFWGPDLVEVYFKNGLRSNILTAAVDANGQHITRGGGNGNTLSRMSGPNDVNTTIRIDNKKVLILNPFMNAMYNGAYNKQNLFDSDFEVSVYNNDEVTYSMLTTLGDYGLIILNTHGVPNGFFLKKSLTLQPNEKISDMTREDVLDLITVQMGIPMEKIENGEIQFDMFTLLDNYHISNKYAMVNVTDKYITNAPFTLDKAVVYGNHCYSGYTVGSVQGNLSTAWRGKGAIAYYGYAFTNLSSGPVLNDYAKVWEDTLITSLVAGDSTGIAHLANDVNKMSHKVSSRNELPELVKRGITYQAQPPMDLFFSHFFEPNYSFKGCGDTLVDARDGQKYATVCIGNQVWMAENLNFATDDGVCYNQVAANCQSYGKLYDIADLTNGQTSNTNPSLVQGECPTGWHMPSKSEWDELFAFCGGAAQAAIKLRSETAWTGGGPYTDEYGFNMLPGGFYQQSFQNLGTDAEFWSCSWDAANGKFIAVDANTPDIAYTGYSGGGQEYVFLSCRCVKD